MDRRIAEANPDGSGLRSSGADKPRLLAAPGRCNAAGNTRSGRRATFRLNDAMTADALLRSPCVYIPRRTRRMEPTGHYDPAPSGVVGGRRLIRTVRRLSHAHSHTNQN